VVNSKTIIILVFLVAAYCLQYEAIEGEKQRLWGS